MESRHLQSLKMSLCCLKYVMNPPFVTYFLVSFQSQIASLKSQLERVQEERDTASGEGTRHGDASRRLEREVRELREQLAEAESREEDALSKKLSLVSVLTLKVLNFWKWSGWISWQFLQLKPLVVGHGGSSAGSYLANPTSPIPSHCGVIVLFKSVPVHQLSWLALLKSWGAGLRSTLKYYVDCWIFVFLSDIHFACAVNLLCLVKCLYIWHLLSRVLT